jgi:hypothetical protein
MGFASIVLQLAHVCLFKIPLSCTGCQLKSRMLGENKRFNRPTHASFRLAAPVPIKAEAIDAGYTVRVGVGLNSDAKLLTTVKGKKNKCLAECSANKACAGFIIRRHARTTCDLYSTLSATVESQMSVLYINTNMEPDTYTPHVDTDYLGKTGDLGCRPDEPFRNCPKLCDDMKLCLLFTTDVDKGRGCCFRSDSTGGDISEVKGVEAKGRTAYFREITLTDTKRLRQFKAQPNTGYPEEFVLGARLDIPFNECPQACTSKIDCVMFVLDKRAGKGGW